ncbi:MAG: MotA/TolQ/ExbB proton channel family protein [Azovibrio sp.]
MQSQIESLMYEVGQFFLLPTLLIIAVLFLYAFYCVGAFLVEVRQRRSGGARPLHQYLKLKPDASEDELDVHAHTLLESQRIATRVTPMLGLVATMIPMGPALKSLSDGNLAAVSENLTVAFSAVILALIAASLTFWVVSVRRRWLAEDLATIQVARRGEHS